MSRYKELKIENKVITDKNEIEKILIEKNFNWILDAEIENSRLEITKDTLIWNSGIWYNGDWEYGVFRHGEWKYGVWKNGVWYNGVWQDGIFRSGIIFGGQFINGQIRNGQIKGGKFYTVEIGRYVERLDKKPEIRNNKEEVQLAEVQLEKKIYNFKQFEALSNQEIDDILDRMSKYGELSNRDEQELKNFQNPNYKYETTIINDIKKKINELGGFISLSELESNTSIVYKKWENEIHLIEMFGDNEVEINIYDRELENLIGSYNLRYEDLKHNQLEEIFNILETVEPEDIN